MTTKGNNCYSDGHTVSENSKEYPGFNPGEKKRKKPCQTTKKNKKNKKFSVAAFNNGQADISTFGCTPFKSTFNSFKASWVLADVHSLNKLMCLCFFNLHIIYL